VIKRKLLHSLGPLVGLLFFSGALWILHHELKAYHLQDIVRHLREIPAHCLLLALAFTFLSYLIMTGYDILALRYVRHPVSYGRIALASFIGYAFSNNMGFAMIAGSSVRYRLYSAWGLSALEITKVVAFCGLSLWLGFFTLGGMVFLFEPMAVPHALRIPFTSVRPLGGIFLIIVAAYLLWSGLKKRPLKIQEWEFPLPSSRLLVAQITVASMDWALAGSVLYMLLPPVSHLSYAGFLGIYLLAQTAGLVSQIPGGLGVFETVVLVLLAPSIPASGVLGALLIFRGIYYLLPLGVAAALLGIHEVLLKKERVQRFARVFGHRVSGMVPDILALTTFLGGAILILSGATPAVRGRLSWLNEFLPLPVVEISHFLGSMVGVGLLILARGLQRRLDAAYLITAALLGFGIIFSLFKGFDYEEGIALSVMLGALLPCRRHFYRKASLLGERFSPGWIAAIVLVMLCSIWLGMFSYKHVEYTGDLWWRFTFSGNAPRFLRATVGAVGLALFFAVARLLRPAPPKPVAPDQADLEQARAIVQGSRHTDANLALLGDKLFLFSRNGNAFIMYGVESRSWVAVGDPVGPTEEWADLVWGFRDISDRYDGWPVFYEVGRDHLHLYLDLGLTMVKLGEEGRVPLNTFSLEGGAHKSLRYTKKKLEQEGCSFEVVGAESVPSVLPELKGISDSWLAEKHTREKGFSLGFFNADYLKQYPAALVRKGGKIVAFANLWQGAEKEDISVDLMRYLPESPHGIMDYLFIQLMLWGKHEGYHWFNLGMAPLSGLEEHALAPLWNRLGTFVFRHGEHFYNFQGLRQYKAKFDPEWEPKYLASPGGMALPRILANLASLISGGIKGAVAK
jgi:phosphatidylglycerol lysyltransferase